MSKPKIIDHDVDVCIDLETGRYYLQDFARDQICSRQTWSTEQDAIDAYQNGKVIWEQ